VETWDGPEPSTYGVSEFVLDCFEYDVPGRFWCGDCTDQFDTTPPKLEPLDFFRRLYTDQRLTILECALRHMRDLTHNIVDSNLDISDEDLESLYDRLNEFMNEPE
jgi:hypothetical protein